MYCTKCGKEVMENSVICPNCGSPVKRKETGTQYLRWLILGCALVSIIATFMPAVTFMGESISFMSDLQDMRAEGIGIIIISIVVGLLGYFKKGRMCSFIPALFNVYVVYHDLSPVIEYGASWGIGAILIMLSNLVIIVGSIIGIVKFVQEKKNPLH